MIEDAFIDLVEPALQQAGLKSQGGEEFRQPPLDVLRYYHRTVRLGRIPILGSAQSVVLVARQPVDLDGSRASYERLLTRLAMASNGRFPPWKGLSIGLNVVVLTPEPIAPGDDDMLRTVLEFKLRRMRSVSWDSFVSTSGRRRWLWPCTPNRAVGLPRVVCWLSSVRALPPFRTIARGLRSRRRWPSALSSGVRVGPDSPSRKRPQTVSTTVRRQWRGRRADPGRRRMVA